MDDWRKPSNAYSMVRDWNKLQGMSDVSDEHIQPRRDINSRHVSIENSGARDIGIAITTYQALQPLPTLQFIIKAGEIKDLAINSQGGPMQYIHILDIKTKKHVGPPFPFRTDSQAFVLRDGLNEWFIQAFKMAGYTAAK